MSPLDHPRDSILRTAALDAMLGVLTLTATMYFISSVSFIFLSFPINYGEGPLLEQTGRLARFENIYPTEIVQQYQTVSNYPPLFHVLTLPLYWVFGPDYWYGRSLNLLCLLGSLFLIGSIIRHLTSSYRAATLGCLFFLTLPSVLYWAISVRVDFLAIFLALLAIRVSMRRRSFVLPVFLITCAFMARQTAPLWPTVTIAAWYILSKGAAGRFIVSVLISCLGAIGVLFLLFGPGIYLHLVTANRNRMSVYQLYSVISGSLLESPLLVLLLGVGLVLGAWEIFRGLGRRATFSNGEMQRLWLAVLFWGSVPTTLASAKVGSSVNYIFELYASAAIFLGWASHRVAKTRRLIFVVGPLLFLALARQIPQGSFDQSILESFKRLNHFTAEFRANPTTLLADDFMGLSPLAGHRIPYQPFEMGVLSESRVVSLGVIKKRIQEREFRHVIITRLRTPPWIICDRWTRPIIRTLALNYKIDFHIDDYYFLVPQTVNRTRPEPYLRRLMRKRMRYEHMISLPPLDAIRAIIGLELQKVDDRDSSS